MPQAIDSTLLNSSDSLSKDTISSENFITQTGKGLVSLFSEGKNQYYEGEPISHSTNIWQFSFLLGMLVMLAVLRGGYGNRMSQFFKSVFVVRYLRQLMREEGFLFHPFSLLLLVNAAVIYSLVAYKSVTFFNWYQPTGSGFLFFLLILFLILAAIFVKLLVLRMMEFLTDTDSGQRENRYSWILFHQFAGMILIPFTAIVLFGKDFWHIPGLIICFSIIIIFLIFRLGKGVMLALNNKVYFLHLFLYLCALEIIPLIVTIKVLVSRMNGFNE